MRYAERIVGFCGARRVFSGLRIGKGALDGLQGGGVVHAVCPCGVGYPRHDVVSAAAGRLQLLPHGVRLSTKAGKVAREDGHDGEGASKKEGDGDKQRQGVLLRLEGRSGNRPYCRVARPLCSIPQEVWFRVLISLGGW